MNASRPTGEAFGARRGRVSGPGRPDGQTQGGLHLGLILAALCSAGCYATRTLAPEKLRAAGGALASPRALPGPEGPVVVAPRARIRAHLRARGNTAWLDAGELLVARDGLALRDGVPAARVATVTVSEIGPPELALLDVHKPTGGAVVPRSAGWQLQVEGERTEALAWAMRFATAAPAAGVRGGWWRLDSDVGFAGALLGDGPRQRIALGAEALRLAAKRPSPTFAPGFRWEDVDRLEVRALDPGRTALALPALPFILLFQALDPSSLDADMSPYGEDGAGHGLSVEAFQLDAGARPLFTGRARRRAIARALVTAGVGGGFQGDFGAGATLGLRLLDLWELGLVMNRVSLTGLGPARIDRPVLGGMMGLHVDTDGDPRLALWLGLEIGVRRSPDAFSMLTLKAGPRFAVGELLFVTLAPVGLSFVTSDEPTLRSSRTHFHAGIDVGAAF